MSKWKDALGILLFVVFLIFGGWLVLLITSGLPDLEKKEEDKKDEE